MAILQTIQLEKRFGGILAAQNVNLAIDTIDDPAGVNFTIEGSPTLT